MAMTGRELCELLSLNYDEIVSSRKKDQTKNIDFFLCELTKIREIQTKLKEKLNVH